MRRDNETIEQNDYCNKLVNGVANTIEFTAKLLAGLFIGLCRLMSFLGGVVLAIPFFLVALAVSPLYTPPWCLYAAYSDYQRDPSFKKIAYHLTLSLLAGAAGYGVFTLVDHASFIRQMGFVFDVLVKNEATQDLLAKLWFTIAASGMTYLSLHGIKQYLPDLKDKLCGIFHQRGYESINDEPLSASICCV